MRLLKKILLICYLLLLVLPIVESEVVVEGDAWKVGTATKILELSEDLIIGTNRETLRNITTFISKAELNALANGEVANRKATSPYYQYLDLLGPRVSVNTGYVTYLEDNNDVTADFLYFKSGEQIGRYTIDFHITPFQSDIYDSLGTRTSTGLYLTDYEEVNIMIFGKTYTIVQARRLSSDGNSIKLILMGGAVKDTLLEGETKTYTVEGKDYETTLDFVSSTQVKFTINGQATSLLTEGESYTLSDGTFVYVSSILYQDYAGGIHSATFYLGTQKMELKDTNVEDKIHSSNLKVGDNTIDDAYVIIEGTDDNSTFKIDRISVNMSADDDFYIPAGGKLSENPRLTEPEVLFTNNWDIEYKGLTEEPIEIIEIITSGLSKYYLRFNNGDGNRVSIPIAESPGGNQISFGNTNNAFINRENLIITKNDYLVLTDSSQKRGERKTYILQYKGADKITADSPVLKFMDLGSGETIEINYIDATPLAILKLGGADYRLYKALGASVSVNDFDIQVDLDGDGILESSGEFIPVTTYYGAEINITNETANRIDFTIKTPDDDRDENAKNSVQTLQATDLTGYITADSGMVNLQRTGNLRFRTPSGQANVAYAYTSYGTFITYNTPSNEPATLKIEYPKRQREALVYITTKGVIFRNTPPVFIATPAIPSSIMEGASHVFKVQVYDPDGDSVTIEWYLDSDLISTTDEYNFTAVSAGVYTIMIVISDGELNDSIEFNVNVAASSGGGGGGGAISCTTPTDSMVITKDTTFCPGTYNLPNGIEIGADNVVLDCGGAVLDGVNSNETAIYSIHYDNVTIINCYITNFTRGIYIQHSVGSEIRNSKLNKNDWAITLQFGGGHKLVDNVVIMPIVGILIQNTNNNLILNNRIESSESIGLNLNNKAFANTVINNSIANSGYGLFISDYSDNNIFTNNHIFDNVYGLGFRGSLNNTLINNTIRGNSEGIILSSSSVNNNFQYNNIYNNTNYNLDNNQPQNITAEKNYWGTTNITEIQNKIYDYYDDNSLGIVDFCPFLNAPYPDGIPIDCDKTPPEAIIKFDPEINDLIVIGIDDQDEDVDVSYEETCKGKKCTSKIRTYTLTDDAGNTLILKLSYAKSKNQISARILSLKYNDEDEIKLQYSGFTVRGFNKFRTLSQNIYTKQFRVSANYNKEKDKTEIKIIEDKQKQRQVENGMVLLELLTNKGSFEYNFNI